MGLEWARRLVIASALAVLVIGCDTRDFGTRLAEIAVTTATQGTVLDDDGYVVRLDDLAERVGLNDLAVFDRLEPGRYTIVLEDVPPNCLVTEGVEREVTVASGGRGEVSFDVVCASVGANVLFESDRGGSLDLYTIDFATGLVVPVTNFPGPDYDAAISPNGTWLAFTSRREGNLEIYRMRPDATAFSNLTRHPAGDFQPAFSPDGTRIAFTSDRDGHREIYVMNLDGSDPQRLTVGDLPNAQPAWLDDTQIVYTHQAIQNELRRVNADTGEISPFPTAIEGSYPAVSPDGSMLAYAAGTEGNLDLYVSDVDGSSPRRLTDHPADDASPAYSPDGNTIAFVSERTGDSDVFLIGVDGTGLVNLTNHEAFDFKPIFVPSTSAAAPKTEPRVR